MHRRTFLLGTSLAWRGLGANEKINVAVVGCGGRGKYHVARYCNLPDARVGAVCDVDTAQTERASQIVEKAGGPKPKAYQDLRKLYEDKEIDAISIATPNHWHVLASIWAMQAGKDVYTEKPASYNMFEGRQLLATARKYNRICQIGMQSRSIEHKRRAIELLHSGAIGKVYLAKGLCFKRRPSIGHTPPEPVPPGLDWDIFLGPAPMRPFTKNRFHYNWHWFWDTGNGDIGNQGIHEMDIARWGLGRTLPKAAFSSGGKYVYDDDQETPNTQIATFDYGDAELVFEVRGLNTGGEAAIQPSGPNFVGNIFLGEKGYLSMDHKGFAIFLGDKREPGESMQATEKQNQDTSKHMENFLSAVKSRNYHDLNGDVEQGVISADLVHMANISYRVKRRLQFDEARHAFVGDTEANAMRTRPKYRAPYIVPEKV
ncbi:MAG TPA: Gfo/Idh/MocA family oxidoreductase [Bryobacteraceae bacterium]|nr:Gfo/Idh/MocA family oxidoreductase [Bryobacteraceae bacterium]